MVGILRKRTIREFFADEGFPKKVSLKYAEGQGFKTLGEFWEDANKRYEKALGKVKEGKQKVAYEKKKEYNADRNQKIRQAKKRVNIDLKDVLKNPRYYDPDRSTFTGKSSQREVNATQKAFMAKMIELQNGGRVSITGSPGQMWESITGLNGSYHASYITKGGLYRAGGFLRLSKDEETLAKMKKNGYITLAQPQLKLSWPVKLNEVDTFWVKEVKPKIDEIKPTTMTPTRYPVEINGIVVYYGKDAWKAARFKTTKKYQSMVEFAKRSAASS
jgi:hypothetical protein